MNKHQVLEKEHARVFFFFPFFPVVVAAAGIIDATRSPRVPARKCARPTGRKRIPHLGAAVISIPPLLRGVAGSSFLVAAPSSSSAAAAAVTPRPAAGPSIRGGRVYAVDVDVGAHLEQE